MLFPAAGRFRGAHVDYRRGQRVRPGAARRLKAQPVAARIILDRPVSQEKLNDRSSFIKNRNNHSKNAGDGGRGTSRMAARCAKCHSCASRNPASFSVERENNKDTGCPIKPGMTGKMHKQRKDSLYLPLPLLTKEGNQEGVLVVSSPLQRRGIEGGSTIFPPLCKGRIGGVESQNTYGHDRRRKRACQKCLPVLLAPGGHPEIDRTASAMPHSIFLRT